jgi:glycosyltransferase involved in cell wall biosynthesis
MFKQHLASVEMQKDRDFEHIVLKDNVGIGVAKANQLFFQNKDRVNGDYVFMLDDDDIFITDDFVSDMKYIAMNTNYPGIIFIRMQINEDIVPTEKIWNTNRLLKCHIGTSCFIMRSDLWKENIQHFASIPTTGDFHFINTVFSKNPKVFWQNKLYSKTLRVSRGQAE